MGFFSRFKTKFERAIEKPRQVASDTISKSKKGEEAATLRVLGGGKETPGLAREAKQAYRILSSALVTEKTAMLATGGVYVFVASPHATKLQVKSAVHELYGVRPRAVRIINMRGKAVRFGRFGGRRKDWKKAIVIMPKGKTLPIYE